MTTKKNVFRIVAVVLAVVGALRSLSGVVTIIPLGALASKAIDLEAGMGGAEAAGRRLASAGTAQELDHFTYLPMVMTGEHLPRPTPTAPRPTATGSTPRPTYTPEAP